MKIFALVVTYNRMNLLKECVQALKSQTIPLNKILIVDNCSTDGTRQYLAGLQNDPQIDVVLLPHNIGGAGGYNEGIKRSIMDGADWVWCMDDDTIPTSNALEELVKPIEHIDNLGFICSKVLWTDHSLHILNIPAFDESRHESVIHYSAEADVLKVKFCSFVSVMVNAKAVRKVGLPIKEFFIWSDDHEFTERIYQSHFKCLYAYNSVVIHKTKENYGTNISNIPIEAVWKLEYGIRNAIYMQRRKKNRLHFYLSALNTYRRYVRRIRHRNPNDKTVFKKVIRKAVWKGIFFNPKIEFLPPF